MTKSNLEKSIESNLGITVRKVNQSDFKVIYQFVNDLEKIVFDLEHLQKIFLKNINHVNYIYMIAEVKGRAVGFISLHSQFLLHHGGQKIGEIQEMYVDFEYRNLGVGNILMKALKEEAQKNEIKQIEVTSNKTRETAHRFYLKEGFLNSHEKFTLPLE
ncbi:MAG: GNAT family N-acetyltransferase [Chitinophagaceae bacterium]